MPSKFIPKHGGYKNLFSYQNAEIIFDATHYFTKRFYQKGDRTIDQIVQQPVQESKTSRRLA